MTRSAFSNLTPPLIFRDWFALNMVFQAVIWPHVLTGLWHLDQAAWVSAAVGAWTLLAGSIIALGCLSLRRSHRVAAMAAVMLLVFGEPLVLAWINRLGESNPQGGYDWAMHVSPIEAVYALSSRAIDFDPSPWTFPLACVALAGVMTWTVLLSVRRR